MNKGKYVFSQLLSFLDPFVFLRISKKYDGDKYVKSFSCWNQLAVMMFGQLSNRESLRDLALATQAHAGKAFHLGFGKTATRSTCRKRTITGTAESSRISPIALWQTPGSVGRSRYSSSEARCMPLTPPRLTCVSASSTGLCSERRNSDVLPYHARQAARYKSDGCNPIRGELVLHLRPCLQ